VEELDTVCELAASNLRFGAGATAEVGQDVKDFFRGHRVVLFTDPTIRELPCMNVVLESLERSGVSAVVYDQVRVEPNDTSFQHAIQFLKTTPYDVVVALGGGSVIDTAKAANLYACNETADFYDFVNPPIGRGMPVPADTLKPLIAIPTTAGTGMFRDCVVCFVLFCFPDSTT
jgi:hydroxyacid-oxoacid transhydrogenase